MKRLMVAIAWFYAGTASAKVDQSNVEAKSHMIQTQFGNLAITCRDHVCSLSLADKPITIDGKPAQIPFSGEAHFFAFPLRFWSGKEDYLLSVHQAADCPIGYRILRILSPDKHEVSTVFGNCKPIEMMGTAGVKFVEFYLPPVNHAQGEGARYLWNLDSSTIYQQTRP